MSGDTNHSERKIILSAPCKVNLTLDVFAPRTDGFHEIDSLVVPFVPADTVTLYVHIDTVERRVTLTCDDDTLPTDERNLAFRAAALFLERFVRDSSESVSIDLRKKLPHQAGLGGGSSDAAAVLRGLNLIFLVSPVALHALASEIGSDVPLFLANGVCRVGGRGEKIAPLPIATPPPLFGILVKPAIGVPTAAAYALLDAVADRKRSSATAALAAALNHSMSTEALGAMLHNDFEQAILPAFPAIAEAYHAVADIGAVRALLCGSGSAIFGLARDREHARALADQLCGRFPYVKMATSKERGAGHVA